MESVFVEGKDVAGDDMLEAFLPVCFRNLYLCHQEMLDDREDALQDIDLYFAVEDVIGNRFAVDAAGNHFVVGVGDTHFAEDVEDNRFVVDAADNHFVEDEEDTLVENGVDTHSVEGVAVHSLLEVDAVLVLRLVLHPVLRLT